MKKSIIKSIARGIGGLLSLSLLVGIGLSNQFINKKDNNNVLVGNDQFINRSYIKAEGTPLPTSGTLSSGTYYLSSDLTVSSQLKITSGNVIVNLNGFTLNGGGRDKGIFYVTGGTLTVNGKDDATGKRGALNNGGGYYPGSGYSYGGALYITAGGATLNDLDITNCQSNWGGAISMSNSAVTLNNCNLSGNKDTNGYGYWGVISVGDSSAAGNGLTINGGEMFSNNGGIDLGNKGKATINGTYIHDNDYYGVSVSTDNSGLAISGNTIIKDNNPSSGNLRFSNNNVSKVGIVSELGIDAYIGVTISGDTKGVFTNSTDTSLNDASKFFSDDANYVVAKNSNGQLYLSNAVATVTSGETVTEYSDFSGAVSSWNGAASGATLTLLKDVTISSTINVSTTKTFDLNGRGINANGGNFPIFTVANGSDLTLNDSGSTTHYYTLADVESNGAAFATICDEATYEAAAADARGTFTGGYLTGANPLVNAAPYPGGGIYILENGVVTMNGGTIIGNIAPNCAGGVGSNGKFIMNDGNIIYNRSRRGAVLASAGEMIINGGHISYNTSRGTDNCGTSGAVVIYGDCTSFLVNGGYFTNNFARYAGFGSNISTISISGNPVIKDNIACGANGTDTTEINVLLSRRSNLNVYFDVVGELTEGAEIGVTVENISSRGVFTNSSDISYNDESKFFGDDVSYAVVKNNDGQLYLTNAVAAVTSGETVTEYSNFSDAVSAWNSAASGATLTLLKDITTSDTINVNNNDVTLDLNGCGIKATGTDYSVLTINDGGKLTIIDSGDRTQYFTIADRYVGNGAGFATVCDRETYDAADENLRGTFQGGYITGGSIINTGFYQNKAGAITVMTGGELDFIAGTIIGNSGGTESPGGVSSFGTFTLNGGNIIYNRGRRGSGVFLQTGTFVMNSGSIEYNTGVGAGEYGTAALHSYPAESISLNGGSISHNYTKYGGIASSTNIFLSGDFVATDNVACGSSGTGTANGNIRLTDGALISGCITGNTPLGITLDTGSGVFTNNTDTSLNDPSKFVSDNPNYAIGVYPAGHANAGQLLIGEKVTVTYTTERGTAPVSDTVASGSIIVNEPTSPSQEGYEFKGWYKDEEFENAWDFATDAVTSNTTLYAKWDYDEATGNVIKLINDIGDLTYAGGVNDSLDDINAARTAYDALTPGQQAVVNGVNKDVLDADILIYNHVDNVGDLINAIPEPSDSQEYYDAVDAAEAAYNLLTPEEKAILGDAPNFDYVKKLNDNVAAKNVIGLISDIGEVTYDGGQNDSLAAIEAAEEAYNALSADQKALVNSVNHDVLVHDRTVYDHVDEVATLIEDIPAASESEEYYNAVDDAKAAFDELTDAEKAIIRAVTDVNYEKVLEDNVAARNVIEKIQDIGSLTYDGGQNDSLAAIVAAENAYNALSADQKAIVNGVNHTTLVHDRTVYDHVDYVAGLINAIPEASESDEYYNAVDTAKVAFDALTPEEQSVLGAAPNFNYVKKLNDNVAARNVIEKIQDIGSLTYDGGQNDSLAAIVAAETAYNALSADQKAIVNGVNHNTLVVDRTIYDHVDNVAILIDAIPAASESEEYYNAVDTAKAAYDNLTDVEQALLGDAPNFNYVKKLNDNVEAKKVIKLIDDINEVTYNGGKDDSLADIINAEKEYNKLTNDQKAIVNAANKETLDHDILVYNHVDNVGDLIKEIPEVSNTDDYYNAVDAAEAAYDLLTPEEKAILGDAIDFNYVKVLEDNIKVEKVIKLIDEIGEITYNGGSNDSLEDIENAEEAYNALTNDQKALVELVNLDTLEEDRETYDAVDETVKLIESIGDVTHGGEGDSKEEIAAAREAYDSLTPEEKELVASYNNSEKVLEDDEAVYGAMEAIDSIGDVTYTSESEEAINHAQEVYDSLSNDQKEQLGDEYKNKIVESKNKYELAKKQGDILFLVLIIVVCSTLVGGIVFLCFLINKKRKDDDNDGNNSNEKNKPVKAMSVGGLFSGVILVSHYLDTKYIILYVLAFLAIVVWIACLIVALNIKRKKAIKEEAKPQQVKEAKPQENNEDEEEVETITDEKGNVFQVRFIKSFTAKLIQSPEETKKYYEELKNEVLSYKGTHSRISWHFDSVNAGRNYVLKFAVRGKTLCVYLLLNADNYTDSKYKVEKVESKKFEDVPCLYRIKNDRRLGYAKELIAVVANNLGLEKGEEQHEVYSNLPYEPNKPLIARGLIKEQKVQVNKTSEQPVVLESKVNPDGDEVIVTKDASGNIFEIRYIKSFTAKLSQSEDVVKDYYTILKNYVMSYRDVHSRVSWHYDAINVGRDYVLKFAIRGKTLCVYYALDASKLDEKYKVEEAKGRKFEDVPVLYRIKNDRRCEYAKELIDLLMKEHGLKQGDIPNEDYHINKESTKALLEKGLIKELKTKVVDKKVVEHYESITVSKADEVMSDEKAEASIEEVEVNKHIKGSKAIINIDTLSKHYNNGDEVTLDSLIEKGLVPSKVGHIKVLARGELNKKLHVVANEYSLQAIKMIVLVGGTVKKIK